MEWEHPQALYFILPLCAAWLALALYSHRRRQIALAAFAATPMWSRIFPQQSSPRFWVKLLLREIAIITGLVALAGPRFGLQYEQVIPRGSDLYVLIDVSRSMLADDVPPSRLGRAKADVSSLVNRLEGERVGLIAFAGQAVVKCPLTIDYDSFRRSLDELDTDSAPRGGTAIGDAIRKAVEVFHAQSDRDQAILLITDGDDQQSYPLEAADVAAERHVTIFTVGLGDSDRGARVPQKSNPGTFLEYQGEQVWSKLDNDLLQQIAIKTSGVYVPAGTKSYDLGELYKNHLQGRKGHDSASQQKIRRSERFQSFLAISFFSLLIDLCIGLHKSASGVSVFDPTSSSDDSSESVRMVVALLALILTSVSGNSVFADEPTASVREGLRLYSKDQFEEAQQRFAAANEELEKQKSAAASIAAFDEACAYHRKGDFEHARESYLRSGLSQDLSVAVASHFNLGTLSAERARTLCGDKPELIAPDKRQEILDQLTQAIAAYRHCLELKPDHAASRRNLELVRQWIKYYSDKWHEQDRQKRRDESNLLTFLQFLIATETSLRETVTNLPETVTSDTYAELKRAQTELAEEIPTLREKIASELRPQPDPNAPANQTVPKEVEEGIALLQSWADTTGQKMSAAARSLGAKETAKAAVDQKASIDEMDKIWEAVIPFHPLLNTELAEQTLISKALNPKSIDETPSDNDSNQSIPVQVEDHQPKTNEEDTVKPDSSAKTKQPLEIADDDLNQWEERQTRALRRARLLEPKAQAELSRLENAPKNSTEAAGGQSADTGDGDNPTPPVDPEQLKAGFQKAIELAPSAVEAMEAAVKSIHQKDRPAAARFVEEARRILEEIQTVQPKNEPQKQDQQNQDQNQNQNQDDKSNEDKKSDEKSNDKQNNEDESKSDQKQNQNKQQPQVSHDRIEEALRKVREREQEKRERDRKMKAQFLGRVPVDKDW